MNKRWWERFREAPERAVAELISGRAGIGSTFRLDVPEMLYQAFPADRTEDRALLDDALGRWLDRMRENYAQEVHQLDIGVYGRRVGDALVALQLLDLPATRERMRVDVDTWVRWLVPLRLAPERDPALECWRLMTRGQSDARHIGVWLRLAEDPRREYLTVALAGLARLPNDDDARISQHLVARALLRHIATNYHEASPARRLFNGHVAALQMVFPRAPEHWDQTFDEVLAAEGSEWPGFVRNLKQGRHARTTYNTARPAPFREWPTLESAIAGGTAPKDELAHRFFSALEQNHSFALATGVSGFFVRTLCNIGHRLLEKYGHLNDDAMIRLGEMIERAMAWEPTNPYCWTFWAKWFEAQHNYTAREWVLREMVRIFPDNEVAHAELAQTLMARGAHEYGEAEQILRRPFSVQPGGGHSVVLLGRLLRLSGRRSEAVDVLNAHLAHDPHNDVVRAALERAKSVSDTVGQYSDWPSIVSANASSADEPLFAQATSSALAQLEHRHALGKEFIKAQVAKETNRGAVTVNIEQGASKGDTLAGFYSQWLGLGTTPDRPAHAWAWSACEMWQSEEDNWQGLAQQFPELAPQTEFLGVLASGGAADGWSAMHTARQGATPNAVVEYMVGVSKRMESIGPKERDDIALAVMGSEATSALEFGVASP